MICDLWDQDQWSWVYQCTQQRKLCSRGCDSPASDLFAASYSFGLSFELKARLRELAPTGRSVQKARSRNLLSNFLAELYRKETWYMEGHRVGQYDWVDLDFGCYILSLCIPGLLGNWQKWLSSDVPPWMNRVTIQVVSNLPLTSKLKFHFSTRPMF